MEESPDVDPSEVSEIAIAVNVAQKTKASKGELVNAVYELEDEDDFDEELAFIIFCQDCFISRFARLILIRFFRGPSSPTGIRLRALVQV